MKSDSFGAVEQLRSPSFEPLAGRKTVLIVEDDPPLARFLARLLEDADYQVRIAFDAASARASLASSTGPPIDLALLDYNLPDGDGVSLLQEMREQLPGLPALMLSARASTEDTVDALGRGADDYLSKPFSYVELLARVEVLLRRKAPAQQPSVNILRVADLTLSSAEHRVERDGRRIDLTPREFRLLEYLMRSPGMPIPRSTLTSHVWESADASSNVVDVYMKYLRDKIDAGTESKLIRTVRGIGFMIGDS